MLAVASVLRWISGSSWGEAGLGGPAALRDVVFGGVAGAFAFVVVALVLGTNAIGELAIVRGNAQALVFVALLTVALAAAAEMVFRGFIMTRVAKATDSWAMGNIVAAVTFGIAIGGFITSSPGMLTGSAPQPSAIESPTKGLCNGNKLRGENAPDLAKAIAKAVADALAQLIQKAKVLPGIPASPGCTVGPGRLL